MLNVIPAPQITLRVLVFLRMTADGVFIAAACAPVVSLRMTARNERRA